MNILVYGWYNKGNCGDESYRLSFPSLFCGHRLTFCDKLKDTVINDNDIIIVGGGNILTSSLVENLWKYKGKRPIHAMSVGCTDNTITKKQLEVFDNIIVRDYRSQKILSDLGIIAEYSPDAAFALAPRPECGKIIIETLLAKERVEIKPKTVVVIVNAHLSSSGQEIIGRDAFRFQTFSFDLANVLDRLDANCIFVPFMTRYPWDDRVSCGWVASKCHNWKKNVVIYEKIDVQQTLDLISAADATISTRLHSSIFSCLSGTPFLDIWHHDKNLSFLETISSNDKVFYWDFSREQTYQIISDFLKNGNRTNIGLKLQKEVREKFHALPFNK